MDAPAASPPIQVRGARQNNLKNINVDLPKGQLIVVTGPSGAGKSSLAIDTIFAEGQRQYIETLSVFSRQFLHQLPKPDVDRIDGLQPTVCINQLRAAPNRRSTVGTLTEIYDYLRVLMARAASILCHECQQPIQQYSEKQIAERIAALPQQSRLLLLAPLVRGKKGQHDSVFEEVQKAGLIRVRINQKVFELESRPKLDGKKPVEIEAVVDRLVVREGFESRLQESTELALQLGKGTVIASWRDENENWLDQLYSTRFACPNCDISYGEIEPRTFSFNSPYGACESCQGLGVKQTDGPTGGDLEGEQAAVCEDCQGTRLKPQASAARLGDLSINEIVELPIDEAIDFFDDLEFDEVREQIATQPVLEISSRLKYLSQVGLGYLSLGRNADSLSGGELQRARLATSLGSGLASVCYVLDEPTIGLHPRDNQRLLKSIQQLKNNNSTVLVVEHDEEVMRAADCLLEIGPAAGKQGGQLVAQGSLDDILQNSSSATARYLAHDQSEGQSSQAAANEEVAANDEQRAKIQISGASFRCLKNLDAEIPLGKLVCLTGVSGSGKSTLLQDIIGINLFRKLVQQRSDVLNCQSLTIPEEVKSMVAIDQAPIGRSSRSNVATYSGVFDEIRKVFAAMKSAKQLGFKASRFSFNAKGGRCEVCKGLGEITVKASFLPDLNQPCESCGGSRYNQQTLQVRYRDHSIADVLNLSVETAREFFLNFEKINRILDELVRVGIGYLKLGQAATRLSGGECQRIKLASELARPSEFEHSVYLMDEPTTGLHFVDVDRLIGVIKRLVGKGNSVIVIEHNLDLIAAADWVIDLGPEGGAAGGTIVAQGRPRDVAAVAASHTGRYLKQKFERQAN